MLIQISWLLFRSQLIWILAVFKIGSFSAQRILVNVLCGALTVVRPFITRMCIKFVSIDLFPVLSVGNMFILIVNPTKCFKQTGTHIDFKVLLLNFQYLFEIGVRIYIHCEKTCWILILGYIIYVPHGLYL